MTTRRLSKRWLLIAIFVLSGLETVIVRGAILCRNSQQRADQCAKNIIFWGTNDPEFKLTLDTMDQFCKKQIGYIDCLQGHEPCLNGFSREMLNLGTKYMKDRTRRFCGIEEERKLFLKHYMCFSNDINRRKPVYECIDRFIVTLKQIRDGFSYDDQFPGLCCTFNTFSSCIHSATKRVCDDVTGAETAKYMEDLVLKSLAHYVDLGCDQYSTKNLCQRNAKNITDLIDWTFADKNIDRQNESAVFPILKVVSGHASDEYQDP